MGVEHYENFPVASFVLPARLRRPIAAIYRFARYADDVADEGAAAPEARLAELDRLRAGLDAIARCRCPQDPLIGELAAAVAEHELPLALFRDLLDAFSQDVRKSRYGDFPELMDYCRRSANPIGRLLLHLFGVRHAEALARSDEICSALQLINHWQDVAIDFARGRIYLPGDDMARFGVSEAVLARADACAPFRELMRFQVDRARAILHRGAKLGRMLRGRTGLEIRLIVAGGDTILQKLIDNEFDVFKRRPVLGPGDWLSMLHRASFGDGSIAA